jgi:hypothetical protein
MAPPVRRLAKQTGRQAPVKVAPARTPGVSGRETLAPYPLAQVRLAWLTETCIEWFLPAVVREVLVPLAPGSKRGVTDPALRLLALHLYLHYEVKNRPGSIQRDWTWTDEMIEAYKSTAVKKAKGEAGRSDLAQLKDEIYPLLDRIEQRFKARNLHPEEAAKGPDATAETEGPSTRKAKKVQYRAEARREPRTLQYQLEANWNKSKGAKRAARAIWDRALREVRRPEYAAVGVGTSLPAVAVAMSMPGFAGAYLPLLAGADLYFGPQIRFRAFLLGFDLSALKLGKLFVAVPGLSRHGRAQAYDFVIKNQVTGKIVADIGPAQIPRWRQVQSFGTTWEDALRQAIVAEGLFSPERRPGKFSPLGHEPWHYDYMPVTAAPKRPE